MTKDILGWMAFGAFVVMVPGIYKYFKHITNKKVAYDKLDNHVLNFHFTFLGLAKVEDISTYGRTKEELCDHLKWIDAQVQNSFKKMLDRRVPGVGIPDDTTIEVALADLVTTLSHVSDVTIYFIKEETNEPNKKSEQYAVHP